MKAFKILGFSDDNTTCDRCGKSELKGTFAIQTKEGNLYRLGSSCINKAFEMTTKEFNAQLKDETKEANKAFYFEYKELTAPFDAIQQANDWTTQVWENADNEIKRIEAQLKAKYPMAQNSAKYGYSI